MPKRASHRPPRLDPDVVLDAQHCDKMLRVPLVSSKTVTIQFALIWLWKLRRTLVVAAAGTAFTVRESQDKVRSVACLARPLEPHGRLSQLPIYPLSQPEIVLQDSPSELEQYIGGVRRAATATYVDAYGRVQDVVSKWIGIEQAVERALTFRLSFRCVAERDI